MPKRTNPFQRLIAYITEQVAPIGATVRESVEPEERGLAEPAPREVDVLIELDTGLLTTRVAIECRDRSRKDDIQWIDGLIGKYANLPVDQVIAISNSGFSTTAVEKAKLNNIITMPLEEASETDWPKQFAKLSMARTKQNFYISAILFETDHEIEGGNEEVIQGTITFTEDDKEDEIAVIDFIEDIKGGIIQEAKKHLTENFISIYGTLGDLEKEARIDIEMPVDGLALQTGGNDHKIEKVIFIVKIRSMHSKVEVERHLLSDKAMVTSAVFPSGEDTEVVLKAVEVADKSGGRLFKEVREVKPKE